MSIVLKHIYKNIMEYKFRNGLVILSLVISTMVIYFNFTIKEDLMEQYKSVLQGSYQDYDYYLYKANVDEEDSYFEIHDLNVTGLNIKKYFALNRVLGTYGFRENISTVYLYGTDLKQLINDQLIVLNQSSMNLETEEKNQIIISERVAKQYHIELEDELVIETQIGRVKMKVVGIADIKGLYLQEGSRMMLMAAKSTTDSINANKTKVRGIYVSLEEGMDSNEFLKEFEEKNKGFTGKKLVDEGFINAELQMVNQLLLFVLAAVIIMVFYLNRCIIKISIAKRMPVIGTVRSIGATKFFMNLLLVVENILYGLIGGSLGILISKLARQPMLRMFSSYGNRIKNVDIHYKVNTPYAIVAIVLVIGLQVFISIFEILKINGRTIKEVIFNTIDTKVEHSKVNIIVGFILLAGAVILYITNTKYHLIIACLTFILEVVGAICLIPMGTTILSKFFVAINGKLFGASSQLASKNIANNKSVQSSIILITVMLSIMVTIAIVAGSINDAFENVNSTFEGDIQLSNLMKDAEEYHRIQEIDGIQSLTFVYYNFSDYIVNGENKKIGLFGFDTEMVGIKDLSGRIGNLSEEEALIDEFYGMRNNIKVGDTVEISGKNMQTIVLKIVGYIDASSFTSSRNVLLLSETNYIQKISPIPICIQVKTEGNTDEIKKKLTTDLVGTGIVIQTVSEFLKNNKQSIDSMLSMFSIILGMAAMLAILGVISNQLIGFLQRKKEYAILYSVAMSKRQLRMMVFFETVNTFFVGCLFGGILGVFLSKTLEQMLFSIGEYVNVNIDIKMMFAMVFGMFVFLVMINLLSLRRIAQLNVVEEIKYE